MKTKLIFFLSGVFLSSGLLQAQANQDCATTAALAYSEAKIKNYEAAYPKIQTLRENCPSYSVVTYQYGERILKARLNEAAEGEKKAIAQDLIKLYEQRLEYFPEKTDAAEIYVDIAQAMYDYNIGTTEEQFQAFDEAYKADKESFSAKSLYTYFTLMVDLQDAGKRELQDVFDLYDEVIAEIETKENAMAEGLAPLLEKQDAGEELTSKEKSKLNAYETNLNAYSVVRGSVNATLGQRADCDNLIPLYSGQFEENKSNVEWLQRAAGRLSAKECTEDPLFFKLVQALHNADPSAESALYLGQLAEVEGNDAQALEYFEESAELQTNPSDKARVYYRIANSYKDQGSFSQARNFYRKALDAMPSFGNAYLQIASMYAQSANNCGESTFEKRAVYWLAADVAARAGRVDPSISSSANKAAAAYNGRAPQRSDIFQEGMAGQTINIGCWIGSSVVVPTL